jgi:hypothetical protein
MNQALEKNGCPARCWADVGLVLTDRPRVFAWTGADRILQSELGNAKIAGPTCLERFHSKCPDAKRVGLKVSNICSILFPGLSDLL